MQEAAQEAYAYLLINPALSIIVALVTGYAACKAVSSEWRGINLLFIAVGLSGIFIGQFVITFFGLKEYLDLLPQFGWLFDFIAGMVGSFLAATFINFFKPI